VRTSPSVSWTRIPLKHPRLRHGPQGSGARCLELRNDESAGKRRSTRLRKGAPWLKTTLIQCAVSGSKKKASYLHAQLRRLCQRHGPKKASCAVAASILTAIYHMLHDGTVYQDLGPDHFQKDTPYAQAKKLAQRIATLGFNGAIAPKAEAAVVSV
jgi:transposase